jgi:hypothetical protein
VQCSVRDDPAPVTLIKDTGVGAILFASIESVKLEGLTLICAARDDDKSKSKIRCFIVPKLDLPFPLTKN